MIGDNGIYDEDAQAIREKHGASAVVVIVVHPDKAKSSFAAQVMGDVELIKLPLMVVDVAKSIARDVVSKVVPYAGSRTPEEEDAEDEADRKWFADKSEWVKELARKWPPGSLFEIADVPLWIIGYGEPTSKGRREGHDHGHMLMSPVNPRVNYEMAQETVVRVCLPHFEEGKDDVKLLKKERVPKCLLQ